MISLSPIGHVYSSRNVIADDSWDTETACIELNGEHFSHEAILGLDSFSHVEVIFLMDKVQSQSTVTGARHPRGNVEWPKVGIFAQRAKDRPNPVGVTVCRILKIEGLRIYCEGLDAINGTPVLDLKPWVKEFGPRGPVFQPAWMTSLMSGYPISFDPNQLIEVAENL